MMEQPECMMHQGRVGQGVGRCTGAVNSQWRWEWTGEGHDAHVVHECFNVKLHEHNQDKATVTSSKSCEGGSSILLNILSPSVCWSSKSFSRHHLILLRS